MNQIDIFIVYPFQKRQERSLADIAERLGLTAECSPSDEGDIQAAAEALLKAMKSSKWIITEMPSLACGGGPEWLEAINNLPQGAKSKIIIEDFSYDMSPSVIGALEVARVFQTPTRETYQFLKELSRQKKSST